MIFKILVSAEHVMRGVPIYNYNLLCSAVASSIIGGLIFIYSCSALFISFEIDYFYGL